jgi:hypothetical protein
MFAAAFCWAWMVSGFPWRWLHPADKTQNAAQARNAVLRVFMGGLLV